MLQGFNLTKCDLLPPDLDSISLKLTRFMCISVLTQVLPDIGVGGWKGGLGWNINIFPLAPMGVLAPGPAHARPTIDTSGNFPPHVSAESFLKFPK